MATFYLLPLLAVIFAKPQQKIECDPNFPHFSAGDFNITQNNYKKYTESKSPLILGISNSECKDCCYLESMLNKIGLLMKTHMYKNKPLEIGRVDLRYMRGFGPVENLDHQTIVPRIAVYKDGNIYTYTSYMHYPLVLYFINKVLHPFVTLNTIEDIHAFIDTTTEYTEQNEFYPAGTYEAIGGSFPGKPHRCVMLVNDAVEYKSHVKKFKQIASKMNYRIELRFGICTNANVVAKAKQLHPEWFDPMLSNSALLFRNKTDFGKIDLGDFDMHYFENWVNEESVRPVLEIDAFNGPIFDKIEIPKVIGYVNSNNKNDRVEMLRRVSKGHTEAIFAYANDENAPRGNPILTMLFNSGATYYFPENLPLTDITLNKFLLNISTQSIKQTYSVSRIEQGDVVTRLLKHTQLVRIAEFNGTVNGKVETLVLLVNTRFVVDAEKPAMEYDKVAVDLCKEEGIRVMYFDMLLDRTPEQLDKVVPPAVFLFKPGKDKIKLSGDIDADNIMEFLHKNSGVIKGTKRDL